MPGVWEGVGSCPETAVITVTCRQAQTPRLPSRCAPGEPLSALPAVLKSASALGALLSAALGSAEECPPKPAPLSALPPVQKSASAPGARLSAGPRAPSTGAGRAALVSGPAPVLTSDPAPTALACAQFPCSGALLSARRSVSAGERSHSLQM